MDYKTEIIKLFSSIPPQWDEIGKRLDVMKLDSEDLTDIAVELCNLCYDDHKRFATYEELCENVESTHSNYFIKSLEILLEYGLIPDGDIDLDWLMYDIPYIKAPNVAAGASRLLLTHGANPNERYDEDLLSAFESLDTDIFYVVPQELNIVQSWMVYIAFGARLSDVEMPLTMLNGYSVEILKDFELFDYEIEMEDKKIGWKNGLLKIYNKQTKEMVAQYAEINWDDYEDD